MKHVRALLFDLDGTLVDPKRAITHSVIHALRKLEHTPPPADELTWCIGPPISHSFERLLGTSDPEAIDAAVALYRERFSASGIYENNLYPDTTESLSRLADARLDLYVATFKPHLFAVQILETLGIRGFFADIFGSTMERYEPDKTSMIARILDERKLEPSDAVMIGDREHDVFGARMNGMMSIGVTHGYGSREELEAAGADVIAASLTEVADLFLSADGITPGR